MKRLVLGVLAGAVLALASSAPAFADPILNPTQLICDAGQEAIPSGELGYVCGVADAADPTEHIEDEDAGGDDGTIVVTPEVIIPPAVVTLPTEATMPAETTAPVEQTQPPLQATSSTGGSRPEPRRTSRPVTVISAPAPPEPQSYVVWWNPPGEHKEVQAPWMPTPEAVAATVRERVLAAEAGKPRPAPTQFAIQGKPIQHTEFRDQAQIAAWSVLALAGLGIAFLGYRDFARGFGSHRRPSLMGRMFSR